MAELDARTIAADIMTAAARDVDRIDVWAHIGQAYDVLTIDENIDAKVLDLIAKAGIDLIWPDGSKDTELDAARVEIERLRAEWDRLINWRAAMLDVARAAKKWHDVRSDHTVGGLAYHRACVALAAAIEEMPTEAGA